MIPTPHRATTVDLDVYDVEADGGLGRARHRPRAARADRPHGRDARALAPGGVAAVAPSPSHTPGDEPRAPTPCRSRSSPPTRSTPRRPPPPVASTPWRPTSSETVRRTTTRVGGSPEDDPSPPHRHRTPGPTPRVVRLRRARAGPACRAGTTSCSARAAAAGADGPAEHVRTAGADDLPALRELFRRSSLSNPATSRPSRPPGALVLPDTGVLAGARGSPSPRTARSSASRRRSAVVRSASWRTSASTRTTRAAAPSGRGAATSPDATAPTASR